METILSRIHTELEARIRDVKHDQSSIIKDIIGDPQDLPKETLELVQAEISIFQFIIRYNQLVPMFSWTDDNGMLMEEPDIKRFSDEQLSYISDRQKECKDIILKARYSHILWLSRVKKIEHGRDAIDSYLELAPYYLSMDASDERNDYWLHFLNAVRNSLLLSLSINYKLDKVKELIINSVLNYPLTSNACSVVRRDLAELMREQKSTFSKDDFSGVTASLEEAVNNMNGKQLHHAVEIVELIVTIEQKLGNDLLKWKKLIAELWEKITYERGVTAAIVTTSFCMKAILAYEEIGDAEKVEELYKFYDELRSNVELHAIPVASELKGNYEFAEALAKEVVKNESSDIIRFLMHDDKIIPQRSRILGAANDENSILDNVLTSVFDRQGNTNRHYGTDDEKNIEKLIFAYSVWLQLSFQMINSIILNGIKTRKLTHDIVLRYLIAESWYGQELEIGKRKDAKRTFKWLPIIAPGIVDFFVAMEGLIYSNKVFNVATSFDSLTMKIEGILRSLAEYAGIRTFVIKRDNLRREVSEEKDIMRLLTEPELIKLIGEDDIFYLRYIFTEKGGLNFRNKVAHSLLTYEQYSIGYLMLVFVAILRLGRFKLKPKEQ